MCGARPTGTELCLDGEDEMAKGEVPIKSGYEHDALTRWRRFLQWRPGQRAQIKRKYNKRVRREAKGVLSKESI